jgi:hypothetical protein
MKEWLTSPTATKVVLGLFLIAIIWWGIDEANSAETFFEVGTTQVSQNTNTGWTTSITQRFDHKYDLTLGYISEQTFEQCKDPSCHWKVRSQIFFGGELLFRSPWSDNFKIGIGPYYFQHADRIATSNFRIGLHIEYRFSDHWGIRARHWSTAGTSPLKTICRPPNDFNQIGVILNPMDHRPENWHCKTNDWNTGQDSFLGVIFYF